MNLARAFTETANAVEDAMLLVTLSGDLVAANRAAAAEFGVDAQATPRRLSDLVASEPARLADFLRRCAGTKEATLAVLALMVPGWDSAREYRLDGALFRPAPDDQPLIRLLLRPKELASRSFALLTQQVDELNREIDRRRRYEAELSDALRKQDALLRELQHRVRNTIQLFLGLLNREARRAGGGAANFRALAARFHAVGFVQKQVGRSSADLNRVELGQLVRDLVGYRHPATGSEAAFEVEVEHAVLPVEVATPLALMLNECLAATLPRQGGRVEGHRGETGRLVLSVAQDGAAEAFSATALDQFTVLLAAQIGGSVACDRGGEMPRLLIEVPVPSLVGSFPGDAT